MCAGRDLGERDSHHMQQWGASEGSVSKVLPGVNRNNRNNRNNRKDVGRQTGCPVRVLLGSPSRANWALDGKDFSGVKD